MIALSLLVVVGIVAFVASLLLAIGFISYDSK